MDNNQNDTNPDNSLAPVTTPVTPANVVTPEATPLPQAAPPMKIHHRLLANKLLLAGLVAIFLIIVAGAVYWFGFRHSSKSSNHPTTASKSQKQLNPALADAVPIDGSTYLESPKALSDLKFFADTAFFGTYCADQTGANCDTPVKATDISYYQIGTAKDGRQIIVFTTPSLTIESNVYYALGSPDGKYSILEKMNNSQQDMKQHLSSNVTIDPTTVLQPLNFPDETTVSNQKLKRAYPNNTFEQANFMNNGLDSIRGGPIGGPAKSVSKIGDSNGLSFYEAVLDDKDGFKVVENYAVYKSLFSFPYVPNGEVASTHGKLAIKWTSGENNLSEYYSAGKSCGTASGYLVVENASSLGLTAVGKTPNGQQVYQLPTSSALVQKLYTEDYKNGDNLDNKDLKNLTVQQITDKHAYFLSQNGLNEYVLFESSDLLPAMGGCAKPVIYLYPKNDTKVSVKVGADITKSDPAYGTNGWQDVLAHPDGNLSYKNKTYPYLFWEGYGNGQYPQVDQGIIIKASDAGQTVKSQLSQQGLTAKEINDFMDYWGPRLAAVHQPYIRLSWLNTAAMDKLAPLNVAPAPQTKIRVFLDFEGLNKPYSLQSQKFSAPTRSGFTLVEWGGFSRTSLN